MTISEQVKKNMEEGIKLIGSARYMSGYGQYEKDTPEHKAYLSGVATATTILYIDLEGTPKTNGFIKQAQLSLIDVMIERLEGEKKSVQELFPNSQINIPTYKLGCETKANKAYNKALQDQIDYLKAEKAIILKM